MIAPMIYPELNDKDILEVLDLTIKKDNDNKLITFLCMLSAYTQSNQINISFNAPSSSGKSYVPIEVSKLFPEDSLIKLGSASPSSFFHEQGEFDKETNTITVDLERKIILFLDIPNHSLLARLRSMLSHDERDIVYKITDKSQKGGLRTKTVVLHGFPAVIFCSANMNFDEQEATRFLLLSPQIDQEKVAAGIKTKIRKEQNHDEYHEWLGCQPKRQALKERILAIQEAGITEIRLPDQNDIEKRFLKDKNLQPRHQRDIGRVISIIKTLALLNLWHREKQGTIITANENDIEAGLSLWNRVSAAQELNLPPFTYDTYRYVIKPLYEKKNETEDPMSFGPTGLTNQDILGEFNRVMKCKLSDNKLRYDIIPMLINAGLIYQSKDMNDGRRNLVFLVDISSGGVG